MPGLADHAPLGYPLTVAAFAHRGRMQRLLSTHGLHLGQERMVFELAQTRGITQSALAARLGVEQPTVAKAVARLARQGLVEVGRDDRDARVTRLYLTPKGIELVDPIVRCWAELDALMGAGLSAQERSELRSLLVRCTENLTAEGGNGPRT